MTTERKAIFARLINLLLPGGGLIVLGRRWSGLTIAILFAVWANLAIGASLIVPDGAADWLANLSIVLAATTYLSSNIRLLLTLRIMRREEALQLRQRTLCDVLSLMRCGEYRSARDSMRGLAHLAETDLLVAYRFAQVVTGAEDIEAAAGAWRRVRELDRHKIYRQEIESHRHLWERPAANAEPEPT